MDLDPDTATQINAVPRISGSAALAMALMEEDGGSSGWFQKMA
jgi:hypothetical protein